MGIVSQIMREGFAPQDGIQIKPEHRMGTTLINWTNVFASNKKQLCDELENGSHVYILSESLSKWVDGKVIEVHLKEDSKADSVVVSYVVAGDVYKKEILRHSDSLLPVSLDSLGDEIPNHKGAMLQRLKHQ